MGVRTVRPDREAVRKALAKALGYPRSEVRQQAAEALGNVGPAAQPAIGALEKLAERDTAGIRTAGREAIARISPS